jgi:hypothetical protein
VFEGFEVELFFELTKRMWFGLHISGAIDVASISGLLSFYPSLGESPKKFKQTLSSLVLLKLSKERSHGSFSS